MKAYKTLKQRIKDKHIPALLALARETNFVFNYVNALSYEHTRRTGKFFSAFDLAVYTKGSTDKDLGEHKIHLHSQTVQAISEEYVQRRKQFKKAKLNWRVSHKESSRYSLGWIPFKASCIKVHHGQIKYAGQWFSQFKSYDLDAYTIKSGCFTEDARGRWYACVVVEVKTLDKPAVEAVDRKKTIGIDLGLKRFATISNGENHEKLDASRNYRQLEAKLAMAQRANKSQLVCSIHAKIKNKRKDEHHKLSSRLVKDNQAIFVGDVNASQLAQTTMAKSVLDASWSMFRTMLEYKCNHAGIYYEKVDERYTTQTCSCCGSTHDSPKGRAGLRIREWTCACGAIHDRDENSALNILVRGQAHLAGGIPLGELSKSR